ncbi:MAG: methylornithine synthase PylB [Thermoproteota archaeon]|nr:MAG: methylornithine synthase PylB [Candidatus Korarchaeota archaeon]
MNQNVFSGIDTRHELKHILEKAQQRVPLSGSDMKWILGLLEPDKVQEVFKTARKLREKYFGNRVFLYGFLYISTYCDNSCNFCLYRKNNLAAIRYRKSPVQIIESSQRLSESGIHLIDLTMGEDPEIFQAGDQGFELLLETIRSVKQNTNIPVMTSAGVLPEAVLGKLSEAGAIWYACYQETHNRILYQKLRTTQDYDIRINSKRRAKELGLLIEEGLLVGVGESLADIVDSIFAMRELRADQVRVMSFVPQKGTPMELFPAPNPLKELLIIALMRLVFPECLIPASLDVGGHAALHLKLAAGANVVTSLIPPGQGLVGVAQCNLDIEDGKRTVAGIQSILTENGLEPASDREYHSWLNQRLKSSSPASKAGNSRS